MISYCWKLFNQIKNIYNIKNIIYKIYDGFATNEDIIIQKQNFEILKKYIFNSGSIYIKFFQWYISKLKSNIVDNSTPESKHILHFITYFEDIFDQCPYHDFEHTKDIFKKSMFGIELEDYIDIDSCKAIASGSIGQVYYARRKKTGQEIAIKVKHPNISIDLENQREIIKLIKILQSISFFRKRYNLLFNIDDFIDDINLQCDFNNEADNCNIFIENFKDSSDYILFPKIIYQSNDVLISEYIEGDEISSLTPMQKSQTTLNFICFFYQMLFVDNFIHGDLHCKNWKIRKNKKTNKVQIIVYDCGICFKNINLELTNNFWFSLVKYDVNGIVKTMKQFISYNNLNIDDNKFETEIRLIFNNIVKESMSTTILLKSIIYFFNSNNIIIDKFLLNLSILICVVEEFMKKNNIINKDKDQKQKASMFDIINDSELDVIAFCDVKKCYPGVRDLFKLNMKDKFADYKKNIQKDNVNNMNNVNNVNNVNIMDTIGNIENCGCNIEKCSNMKNCGGSCNRISGSNNNSKSNNTIEKKLFSSISLSGLTFKPPGS